MGFLSWLEGTAYSQWIITGLLGWPLMLSMHAIGLAAVVGITFALNLRVLGFFKPIPYTGLNGLLVYGWLGVIVNAFSGLSLFIAQGTFYVTNVPFLFKITFVILGIVILHLTQRVLREEAATWEDTGVVSQKGTGLAIGSIVFWTLAVVCGRLIAYL